MYTPIEVSNIPVGLISMRQCCDTEEGGYHQEGCPRLAEIRKEYPHAQSVESMAIAVKLFPWWAEERQED